MILICIQECDPLRQVEDEKIQDSGPADASVYTFGFGEDHDPVMLKKISDAGNGMYYYIENKDQVDFCRLFHFDFQRLFSV